MLVMSSIKSFTDLKVWKKSHTLAIHIYKETSKLPKSEEFGIKQQIRRSAVSVTSNIAEGFGRYGLQEKIQFYYMANGSLCELHNQLLLSKDVGLIKSEVINKYMEEINIISKMLYALINTTRNNKIKFQQKIK
jgi:four helix bundle protein